MKPLVLILGPTGVGKSDFGLAAAERFKGFIVNFDSIQVYRGLDIGSAKPDLPTRSRLPHFMFDVLNVGARLTAADFLRMVSPILDQQLPQAPGFGVGGSGFYIQAVEKGMYPAPPTDPNLAAQIRQELSEKGGPERLYQELKSQDPIAAAQISPNDHYRLGRALAVLRTTGQFWSEIQKSHREAAAPPPWPIIKLGLSLSRDLLKKRLEVRAQRMLEAGLVEEVKALVADGFGDWPALQSVGYKEVLAMLSGRLDQNQLVSAITTSSMQLAKKQMTWFRRDPQTTWFDAATELPAAMDWLSQQPGLA